MAESRRVIVAKASPTGANYPTPKGEIDIVDDLPVIASTEDLDRIFEAHAALIEGLLNETLPGGTYDRLLGRMLARKASHYRVPFGDGR
jgi:hypothetical protein